MNGGMIGMLLQNRDGNLRFVVPHRPVEIKIDGVEIPVRLENRVIPEMPDVIYAAYSNPDDIIKAVEALVEAFSGEEQKRRELRELLQEVTNVKEKLRG